MSCQQVPNLVMLIINLQLSGITSLKSPMGNTFLKAASRVVPTQELCPDLITLFI